MLSKERIEALASRKGVKRIAVVNFLSTVDANENMHILEKPLQTNLKHKI